MGFKLEKVSYTWREDWVIKINKGSQFNYLLYFIDSGGNKMIRDYNLKEISYLLYIFVTEKRLNHYLLARNKKFIQICKIYQHYGNEHKPLIKKIIQHDRKGVGNYREQVKNTQIQLLLIVIYIWILTTYTRGSLCLIFLCQF